MITAEQLFVVYVVFSPIFCAKNFVLGRFLRYNEIIFKTVAPFFFIGGRLDDII